MDRYIEFVVNFWFLFALLAVILVLLGWNLFGSRFLGVKQVGPMQATQLINRQDAVVVDVRDKADFSDGHILNALHKPLTQLQDLPRALAKYRARPVIIYCTNGSASIRACRTLLKEGFTQVYNLKGGILAWRNANLPLTKK